jgi:hypothetical protein
MCGESWLQRRREREAEEARRMWEDFDRTTPIADPEPRDERPEPEHAEAREETAVTDR